MSFVTDGQTCARRMSMFQHNIPSQRIVHEADPEYLFSPLDGEAKLERQALEIYFPTNYTGGESRSTTEIRCSTAMSNPIPPALQTSILPEHRVSGEEVDFWSRRATMGRSFAKRYLMTSLTSTF